MILIVIAPYRNRKIAYTVGQRLDLPDADAAALLIDSPGSFQVVRDEPPAEKTMDEPPADKMIRRASRTKGGA